MVQPLHSLVLPSFFLALSFTVAFTSKQHYPWLKSLHFALYEQDIFNKTAYVVVNGVDTGVPITLPAFPFGTVFVFNEPLTVTPDPSSDEVGTVEGISMISTREGLQNINALQYTLSYKNHKGTISVVGVVPNVEPGNLTVGGGTGDFLFVQGYITVIPYNRTSTPLVFLNDFHLYWPPYAASY